MKALLGVSASVIALMTPVPVLAQSVAEPALSNQSAAQGDGDHLDVIIVTAERRSANVQDTPVSVGVVGGDQLKNTATDNILTLSAITPSLTISNTNGYVNASIRGIGSTAVGPGTENQVALYVDGVYYGSQAGSKLNFINVDQIAVLRGPQGTLFGRNATAGVLQVTTREPSNYATGEIRASLESYSRVGAEGYASTPLSDTLAMDFAFSAAHQSGSWGINRFNATKNATVDHDVALRSQLLFKPSSATKIKLAADYSSIEATTVAQQRVLPGTLSGWVPDKAPQPDIGYDTDADSPSNHYGHSWGVSLNVEQDIGMARLVSISALRRDKYTFVFDYDYGPEPIEWITTTQPNKQFSQEIRLQSQPESRLKWVAGGYYYRARAALDPFYLVGNDLGINLTVHNAQIASSIAGFGQATYDILPNTNLTLGVRYTEETRKARDGSTDVTLIDGNVVLPTTFAPDRRVKMNEWTYRITLDHRFSDSLMAYASYNTGFKAGGFNTSQPGSDPYLPESLKAWEVGFKSDLLDRHLRLNVSGYYYDYVNIQVQQLLEGATTVTNGARAKIYGAEAELTAVLTDKLTLSGGLSVSRPKFKAYPDCLIVPSSGGVPATTGSCAGNTIPLAPDVTFNVAANYATDISYGRIAFNTNLYYNDGFAYTVDNNFRQGAYAKLGASVRWTDPSDRFSVSVYGRNLTNQRVANMISLNTGNGNAAVLWAEPRIYGVKLGYKF